jgi:hypothetical protein
MTEKKQAAEPTSSKVRMTAGEQARAIMMWKSGRHTLMEVAAETGRDESTLVRLYRKHGIKKGSAPIPKNVADPAAPIEPSENDKTREEIKRLKEDALQTGKVLQALAMGAVKKAHEQGARTGGRSPFKDYAEDLKVIKAAMEIVRMRREEAWVLLQVEKYDAMDEIDNLPELTVEELTVEQAQAQAGPGLVEAEDSFDCVQLPENDEIDSIPEFDGESDDSETRAKGPNRALDGLSGGEVYPDEGDDE